MDDSFVYLSLGDSITAGNNVRKRDRYPMVLAGLTEQHTHRPLYVRNMGKSGLSSSGLLKLLNTRQMLNAVHHAHLVTICIGGDDLIYAYFKWRLFRNRGYLDSGIEKFARNFHEICHLLAIVATGRVILGTFYNPFPHTPLAVYTVEYCNYRIIQPIAAQHGFPVADIYASFRGREPYLLQHYRSGLLEEYRPFSPKSPIHPNVDGYRVIAHQFAAPLLMF